MPSPRPICELKSGFFACKETSFAFCQYCGRNFCANHGIRLEDGQEICSRKVCVAKREDLKKHLVYKAAAVERNLTGACGIAGCKGRVYASCARCGAYYCSNHVSQKLEKVYQNQARIERMASLCRHCWVRRPIWLRK